MRRLLTLAIVLLLLPLAVQAQDGDSVSDARGMTVQTRFPAPAGFVREMAPPDSFASYLRRLPLKPHGAELRTPEWTFNAGDLMRFREE